MEILDRRERIAICGKSFFGAMELWSYGEMVVSLDCLSCDVGSIPTSSELLNRSLALNDGE